MDITELRGISKTAPYFHNIYPYPNEPSPQRLMRIERRSR